MLLLYENQCACEGAEIDRLLTQEERWKEDLRGLPLKLSVVENKKNKSPLF